MLHKGLYSILACGIAESNGRCDSGEEEWLHDRTQASDKAVRASDRAEKYYIVDRGAGDLLPAGPERRGEDDAAQNITSGSIQVDGKAITTSTLDTGVSYIENFAKHFNLPVQKLLRIASEVNPNYDYDFAAEMMDRFELEGKKKFRHLSLGMKTMVSTIICLASNKDVILLDEPVLGFDALMRVEFYDMLTESFQKHPRIILVSTHIIEEIAKTIQKLILIDRGSVRFFDTLQAVETKAFCISGLQKDVEAATKDRNVIGQDVVGGLVTSYIFDNPPEETGSLEIRPLSLQEFFIQMVGHKGGWRR